MRCAVRGVIGLAQSSRRFRRKKQEINNIRHVSETGNGAPAGHVQHLSFLEQVYHFENERWGTRSVDTARPNDGDGDPRFSMRPPYDFLAVDLGVAVWPTSPSEGSTFVCGNVRVPIHIACTDVDKAFDPGFLGGLQQVTYARHVSRSENVPAAEIRS